MWLWIRSWIWSTPGGPQWKVCEVILLILHLNFLFLTSSKQTCYFSFYIWGGLGIIFIWHHFMPRSQHHKTDFNPSVHIKHSRRSEMKHVEDVRRCRQTEKESAETLQPPPASSFSLCCCSVKKFLRLEKTCVDFWDLCKRDWPVEQQHFILIIKVNILTGDAKIKKQPNWSVEKQSCI